MAVGKDPGGGKVGNAKSVGVEDTATVGVMIAAGPQAVTARMSSVKMIFVFMDSFPPIKLVGLPAVSVHHR